MARRKWRFNGKSEPTKIIVLPERITGQGHKYWKRGQSSGQ